MSIRNYKSGQIAVTALVTVGTIMVGWLFLGVNKAQDVAASSLQKSNDNTAKISALEAHYSDIDKKLDSMEKKLDVLIKER